jgi:4-hydroxy-4-methyl-2-oxoglutarate aldolase
MATETELSRIRANLFGQIDEERIARVDIVRPGPDVTRRFLALTDLCSTVADALDDVGTGHTVSGSVLARRTPGGRLVGPAVTVRYVREGGTAGARIARGERAGLADRDLYGVAEPDDVAVFDCGGVADASVMGGLSANWARRRGMAGCVVDGAVRDLESVVELGLPVWSRAVTPRTGKHRMRAIEINGPVALAGCPVVPGDLVVADGSGVCIVPAEAIDEVLGLCEQAEATERKVLAAMATASSPAELTAIYPASRW